MKRAVARHEEGRCLMDEHRAPQVEGRERVESVQLEARLRLGVQHPRHAHYGLSRGESACLPPRHAALMKVS
jgi:hypothetical protein